MRPERLKQLTLILIFLVIIFIDGVSLVMIQLLNGERPVVQNLFTQLPTQQNLRQYEDDLVESSWFVQQLRPLVLSMRYEFLNDLGKKAIQGLDGWLFYDLDVRYLAERLPHNPDPATDEDEEVVRSILSFRKQLEARGIQLLLLPAPGKPSVYPEKLTHRAPTTPHHLQGLTMKILSRLESEGIQWMDLFNLYQTDKKDSNSESQKSYLVQDTHWSPYGMKLAATAVAERLLELGWTSRGTSGYIEKTVDIFRFGDVLRMSQIPGIEKSFRPEKISTIQILQKDNQQPYSDDSGSDILVLGDSFLRIYEKDEPGSAGFVSHLAYHLQKPLTSIINDGGASTLVRQELYRKPHLLQGKKVVIWEFVERDIRFGTEGWQDIPLPHEANGA